MDAEEVVESVLKDEMEQLAEINQQEKLISHIRQLENEKQALISKIDELGNQVETLRKETAAKEESLAEKIKFRDEEINRLSSEMHSLRLKNEMMVASADKKKNSNKPCSRVRGCFKGLIRCVYWWNK